MRILAFLTFLAWFYLFVTSGALTYLSVRAWLSSAPHGSGDRLWHEGSWARALRATGFAGVTLAALLLSVSERGARLHLFDVVSLVRIAGYVLLLVSTPPRLRRQSVVALAFALQLLGESLLLLNGRSALPGRLLVDWGLPAVTLVLVATLCMDGGMALLWQRYTRTVLRVRLTDRFTLAFAVFSLLLMLVMILAVFAVIQASLHEMVDSRQVDQALQALSQPIIVLFIAGVTTGAIISYFLARNLIAPVNRMGAALRAIGQGDLDYRLRGIRSRDEMQDLAHEINEMARRLREADSVRAEFVSFASHELRSPLTAIKGFVETLQMRGGMTGDADILPEQRAEIYGIIHEECERLLRMTNELLDTSRVQAGRPVVLNVQTFDARRSSDKVVGIMRTHTQRHELMLLCPNTPLLIEADLDKFEQILINLLSNAIKYSPDGGLIEVFIRDLGQGIEVAVRDRGLGMTSEQAEHVFDKFYRIGEGGKAAAVGGAGLGLYLTRALVNAHGGAIQVESVPREGSTFTFMLPKKHRPSTGEVMEADMPAAPEQPRPTAVA